MAFRTMRRAPTFTATALLVVILGLGAFTAIFSAANAYFFRPLPFGDAGRLVALYETNPEFGWEDADAAPANALDWREQVEAFADLAVYSSFTQEVTHVRDGEPSLVGLSFVSGNFFSVLGVRPALGAAFTWEDTWTADLPGVMLSDALWRSRFGADADIVGRTLELNGQSVQVRGVMPPSFRFPSDDTELWGTMGWDRAARDQVWFRRAHFVRPVARLADGVDLADARAQLAAVVSRLQREYPETNRVMGAGVAPLRAFLIRDVQAPLRLLLGAVGLLLLVACLNLANLNLVRVTERSREMAVRMALGAGRARVARQLITESVVLCLLGGVLGLWVGWGAVQGIGRLSPLGIEGATAVALDPRVVGIGLAVAGACGVIFGLVPAFLVRSGAPLGALREGTRSVSRGRRAVRVANLLVGAEIALALLLVVGAGLVLRSFVHLRGVDPGFQVDGVLSVQLTASSDRYPERDDVLAFWDRLVVDLEARPDILRAGTVGRLPLDGTSWSSQVKAAGWPADRVGFEILHRRADAGYFEALDIPLVDGRMFGPEDDPDGPNVVVINERFREEHFPGEDPLGQRIAYDREPTESSVWYEIVGVVGDQHQVSPGQPPRAEVFENRDQDWGRTAEVVVRTSGEPLGVVPTFRDVLRQIDPLVAMSTPRPLRGVWRESTAQEAFLLSLLGAFALLSLVLATVGVYGVTAEAARRRTREVGIRIALGARRAEILALMLRQGLPVVFAGIVLGLLGSFATARLLEEQLHGVQPHDPATLGSVAVLLALVAVLASLLPAHRSTRVDPVESLRAE